LVEALQLLATFGTATMIISNGTDGKHSIKRGKKDSTSGRERKKKIRKKPKKRGRIYSRARDGGAVGDA